MKKLLLALFCLSFISSTSYGQWSSDPSVADTKVFTGVNFEGNSYSVPDGSGGAIVAWESSLSTGDYSISYNRLDNTGALKWAAVTAGVQLTLSTGELYLNHLLADGSGGAFICWEDDESGYTAKVQHISSTGTKLWGTDGVTLSSNGYNLLMCSDGAGGVIVSWIDDSYDPVNFFPRGFAQRVSSAGSIMWAAGGVRILNTPGYDAAFAMISDGVGGAIFSLGDTRNDTYDPVTDESDNIDIFAQRLNSAGTALWGSTGVAVCTDAKNQSPNGDAQHNYMVSDGAGGAIIGWEDYRSDPGNGNSDPAPADIYAQRLSSSGAAQWTANGVAVCTATGDQNTISMVSDGANGAVFAWQDDRTDYRLYAQRLNASGAAQWTANGKAVASLTGQFSYTATADATGSSMLVAWAQDFDPPQNITAQKISVSDASFLWGTTGTLVCGRTDAQTDPAIASNGGGGAIISWTDQRIGSTDIYANRVLQNGSLPISILDFGVKLNADKVLLNWTTSIEINSKDFNIQRSKDGVHFENVGNVAAAGNSSISRNYIFEDLDGFSLKGKDIFYRIVETDVSGQTFYSAIQSVRIPSGINKLTLAYNPVKNTARLRYESIASGNASIRVLDLAGKVVLTKHLGIFPGMNDIQLATGNLSKGIYQIELSSNNHHAIVRMLKE
ncbi:MAG: T9SS type A sorting domain-containing protein [Ginsengibacter sp.]